MAGVCVTGCSSLMSTPTAGIVARNRESPDHPLEHRPVRLPTIRFASSRVAAGSRGFRQIASIAVKATITPSTSQKMAIEHCLDARLELAVSARCRPWPPRCPPWSRSWLACRRVSASASAWASAWAPGTPSRLQGRGVPVGVWRKDTAAMAFAPSLRIAAGTRSSTQEGIFQEPAGQLFQSPFDFMVSRSDSNLRPQI